MNGSVNLDEASQPCFDASSSKLAWGSLDGRLRLFDVNSQQIVADITQDVSDSSIAGKSISKSVYSCLGWGQGKVRFGKMASMRGMQHCSTAKLDAGWVRARRPRSGLPRSARLSSSSQWAQSAQSSSAQTLSTRPLTGIISIHAAGCTCKGSAGRCRRRFRARV
jgi:WD40 repeat protein